MGFKQIGDRRLVDWAGLSPSNAAPAGRTQASDLSACNRIRTWGCLSKKLIILVKVGALGLLSGLHLDQLADNLVVAAEAVEVALLLLGGTPGVKNGFAGKEARSCYVSFPMRSESARYTPPNDSGEQRIVRATRSLSQPPNTISRSVPAF